MTTELQWQQTLTRAEIAEVDAMLDRVGDADGVSSLSEHAYLHLLAGGGPGQQHLLARRDGRIAGYAFLAKGEGELLVDPAARGRGLGSALLAALQDLGGPGLRLWAHGDLPAGRVLAERAGLEPVRRLCRYTRPLEALPERPMPEGYQVRPFTPDDGPAWLELNAAAFVDLPDQGTWTQADLEQRLRQPWFDPQGFLLSFDDQGLAGAHWTKVHTGSAQAPVGEVYVLAVAARARGTGLAAALTIAGLQYLREQGLAQAMLYVDAANAPAVSLYTRLGFTRADCDVQYRTRDHHL